MRWIQSRGGLRLFWALMTCALLVLAGALALVIKYQARHLPPQVSTELSMEFPIGTVALDTELTRASDLVSTKPHYKWIGKPEDHVAALMPPVSDPLKMVRSAAANDAIVFLHDRSTPTGAGYLVKVEAGPGIRDSRRVTLIHVGLFLLPLNRYPMGRGYTCVLEQLVAGTPSTTATVAFPVRLFAAQPDPEDPGRFTIQYELGHMSGYLEGTLVDFREIPCDLRVVRAHTQPASQ